MSTPKAPYALRPFVRGPAVSPGRELLAWLDQQTRVVRLPIIVARGQVGYSLHGARIGRAEDAVVVDLDDSALGVGVGDHARSRGEALWLEGRWRREGEVRVFQVLHVHTDAPPDHVEVAAE